MRQERKALDATAFSVMLLLTALWGFQQVTIKWIAQDVSLVMQAAIRSIAATLLLIAWARLRGIALFDRDGTLRPGIVAGLLFAAEFVFIYAGLAHTNVSRMSVFIYLTPALTALGVHFFVRGERLGLIQWSSRPSWFWLLTRYLAARLSVLSFLTPMFGVLCGVIFLREPRPAILRSPPCWSPPASSSSTCAASDVAINSSCVFRC